ncbi:cysteine--tRNA ligase [Pigmentiphaga litoralis]|uniref:cysteine--tRNA ligase n=1 Tax=Pigmentiphaga litoralis TaxID=516702 RepID=UPI0016742F0A|nr:cysteine--tRNA ligase [Pigmentiphaga litoralis]GGX09648.1 cysteine--tRNA ligase [Pigmentiphaga litoralis]
MLQIYNTLARAKQPFQPRQAGCVSMYVCGMTVYDYCHLGHARMLVSFDIVQRWLRASGYQVNYVRNITDIDDKIIRRAVESGKTITQVTEFFIDAMHEDEKALGVQPPDHEPRATKHVGKMLDIVRLLEDKGLAYRSSDGDVNYAVRQFPGYGKLSGKSLDDLRAGERVKVDTAKRDPLDFVLWKAAKPAEPPESKWESPYGVGRPGWHIECSAMSMELLGMPLDIHGGGPDLKFPHHENEIAQSEGAYGGTFANTWMHCGPLMVDAEKMSKSLGNFFTIRDTLEHYDAEVIRYFIVRSHYRSPQNYAGDNLADARSALTRLYTTLANVAPDDAGVDWDHPTGQAFKAAMDDDFNTPEAVAALFELSADANKSGSARAAGQLKALGGMLGLLGQSPREFLQGKVGGADADTGAAAIEARIEARAQAKKDKNFAEADRLRAELLAEGIVLEDKPGGVTVWRRA